MKENIECCCPCAEKQAHPEFLLVKTERALSAERSHLRELATGLQVMPFEGACY
jgi:hypothetical protein